IAESCSQTLANQTAPVSRLGIRIPISGFRAPPHPETGHRSADSGARTPERGLRSADTGVRYRSADTGARIPELRLRVEARSRVLCTAEPDLAGVPSRHSGVG